MKMVAGLPSNPGYLGNIGMRHYHLKRNLSFCPAVSLDKLDIDQCADMGKHCQKQDWSCPIIDEVRSGSYRVLMREAP
jgi:large subunit ribosomal protein L27Ae